MLCIHEVNPIQSQTTQNTDFKKYFYHVFIMREFKIDGNSLGMSIVNLNEENIWCAEYCMGQFIFDIMMLPENSEGFGRIAVRFAHFEDAVAFRLIFK